MIRILLVDDHPALRTGLLTVLRREPGLIPVGAVSSADELWTILAGANPDVVLLDYHLPGDNSLGACRRLKSGERAPRVIVYSAYADAALALPASLAGADGLVSKGAPADELFEAVREVAGGGRVMPPIPPEMLRGAQERLEPDDWSVVAMLLDGSSTAQIAEVLGRRESDIDRRLERILARVAVEPTVR